MKSFIKKTAEYLFLLLLLILLILFTFIIISKVRLHFSKLDSNVDSIIIGDSHTTWAIDASPFPNIENVSLSAEGYRYSYLKLKHIIETQPNIQKIYLGMGYHNFSDYYDEYNIGRSFIPRVHQYLSVLTFSDYFRFIKNNPKRIGPFVRSAVINSFWLLKNKTSELYSGYFPYHDPYAVYSEESMKKRVNGQYYKDGKLRDVSDDNLKSLLAIIKLCHDSDRELYILNTPVHKDYYSSIPVKFIDTFWNLADENNLIVFDFKDLKLSDDQFLPDGDHINYNGIAIVTQRFKEYINENQ